jgi:hypothetical protein
MHIKWSKVSASEFSAACVWVSNASSLKRMRETMIRTITKTITITTINYAQKKEKNQGRSGVLTYSDIFGSIWLRGICQSGHKRLEAVQMGNLWVIWRVRFPFSDCLNWEESGMCPRKHIRELCHKCTGLSISILFYVHWFKMQYKNWKILKFACNVGHRSC